MGTGQRNWWVSASDLKATTREVGEVGMSRAELIKKFSDYVYYFNAYCTSDAEDHEMLKAVLAMLKEQEAVEPKKVKGYNPPMYTLYEYECEKCKSPMMNKQPYCMGCGREVEWE